MSHTLPHTEITLPLPVVATNYRQLNLYDGLAYTTDLAIDGTHVGTIENEGRGGDTLLRTTNPHRPAWQALVEGARDRHGAPLNENELLEELVNEADFNQQVQRLQSSHTRYSMRVCATDGVMDLSVITFKDPVRLTPGTAPARLAQLHMPADAAEVHVWVKGQWVQLYPRL